MKTKLLQMCRLLFLLCGIVGLATELGAATLITEAIPITGVDVSELNWVDKAATNFMTQSNISSGLIGIMRNGTIIYQRGFGWKDKDKMIPMQENALVRLASCTKPITAAAIRKLEEDKDKMLSVTNFAFNLGQTPEPGIIAIQPFPSLYPSLGHTNPLYVTVQHCLEHSGGWNGYWDNYDYAFQSCDAASALGVASPPGVSNIIAWALGQPLDWEPGSTNVYSNFGYMVLGRIIEERSGMHVIAYHRKHVLTPDMWVPKTDLLLGETFATNNVREAWYDADGSTNESVFPTESSSGPIPGCSGVDVETPYGSWDHESFVGFGGIVASAAPMLELAEQYVIGNDFNTDVGTPLRGTRVDRKKGGAFSGVNTLLAQRSNGVNVFIFFNKNDPTSNHYAATFYTYLMKTNLNDDVQTSWPTTNVAGFWVDPDSDGARPSKYGSYCRPFAGFDDALDSLADGSRVNFKKGTSHWTGTISTKLELRAPLGTAVIGAAE